MQTYEEEKYDKKYILPNELWEEVFGYLTHTEKLISRLVCSKWNRVITSHLSKHSLISLSYEETEDFFLESSVPWKKICLVYDRDFKLRLSSRNKVSITTVHVSFLNDWSDFTNCLQLLSQLPSLINLDINFSIVEPAPEKGISIHHEFKESVKRLKELSILIGFNDYNILKPFLEYFPKTVEKMCLTKLSIKEERWPSQAVRQTQNSETEWFLPKLYDIISKSSGTLTFLELQFYLISVQRKLFTELIQNISTLHDLKLKTVLIRAEGGVSNQVDFDIHQKFLKNQIDGGGALKRLTLPWCSNAYLCEEFMRNLPTDIECIESVRKEHTRDSIYRNHSQLKSMSFTGSRELTPFNQPCPNIQSFYIYLQGETNFGNSQRLVFYQVLGLTLTNLVELHIIRGFDRNSQFDDNDLQLIIYYFNQLRVLHIDCADKISDVGVTGVTREHVMELKITRRLYSCPEIFKENIIGLPLSSLRSLEKLIFKSSWVSDLGIYYGLRFGSRLKQLTIFSRNVQVSDWGIEHLGAGNPCLESFNGEFSSEEITAADEILLQQIPMVEYTNKFMFFSGPSRSYL